MAELETCWADISLAAFSRNVRNAKVTLAHEAQLMIAVKSQAYGHGEPHLAKEALRSGASSLAVLDIDTGVALRPHVGDAMLLAWLLSPSDDFAQAAEASLHLGISALWQLEKLRLEAPSANTSVHLKIDTGLHRNGSLPGLWPDLVAHAKELEGEGVCTVVAIWSHLADTSPKEDRLALARFHHAVGIAREGGLRPNLLHIAASSAASDVPESRLDMVRVGISAYGVSPFDDRSAADMGFEAVMRVTALVTSCDVAGNTATLGMGYGDGLLPLPAHTGWVAHPAGPLNIAEVGVEEIIVGIPQGILVTPGDIVTLWGGTVGVSPTAEQWASWGNTIGDEVVASLASHVPRRFTSD